MHGCAPSCLPQVDPLDRHADARHERIAELVLGTHQREHRPVVVGVRVDVEQPGVRGQSVADCVDRRLIAPSLKFGTDSSGSTRLLYEWMKEYYDLRAPYYDDW